MFVWRKEFELGIKSIDTQHKRLLEIGNKIYNLLASHKEEDDHFDEIYKVIGELKEYTIYHFETEENYFLKYHYPDYESHKKEHDAFIDYLNSVDYDALDENQGVFLKKLLEKIFNWVFNHIVTTDYMYVDYLKRLVSK
jgi:hemerythrin